VSRVRPVKHPTEVRQARELLFWVLARDMHRGGPATQPDGCYWIRDSLSEEISLRTAGFPQARSLRIPLRRGRRHSPARRSVMPTGLQTSESPTAVARESAPFAARRGHSHHGTARDPRTAALDVRRVHSRDTRRDVLNRGLRRSDCLYSRARSGTDHPQFAVERKSGDDFLTALAWEREQFTSELRRAAEWSQPLAVVVETSWETLLRNRGCMAWRDIHPNQIVGTLSAWTRHYNVVFHFPESRRRAELCAFLLLVRHSLQRREQI
jgi:hypothetical protein